MEIETNAEANHVTGLLIRTLAGNRLTIDGRLVVLALGGIENPRLLCSRTKCRRRGSAIGHDLVGRYFSEHPTLRGGVIQPASAGVNIDFYRKRWFDDQAINPVAILPPSVRQSEQIAPVIFQLFPIDDPAYRSEAPSR